jgi:hypothetical protein
MLAGRLKRRLTSLRFCCAANVVTASEAREPDVYRDCRDPLLGGWRTYDAGRFTNHYAGLLQQFTAR